MANVALKIEFQPRQPLTVNDLPFKAAANTNIEIEMVESFAQKTLRVGGKVLGHALFYMQFLEFEGDTAHHAPIIDQPPNSKTVPQWLAEMEETIRVATEIGNKQAEIHRHQINGQVHLARRAQQELNQLLAYAQTIQNSTSAPFTSGALKMVASADGADGNHSYLDDIRREAAESPHLGEAQRQELAKLIDEALVGQRPVVDVAHRVYELRRDISARSGKHNSMLTTAQVALHNLLARIDPGNPGFGQRIPSFDELLHRANFTPDNIVFTTQPTPRNEINQWHRQGKSICLVSLADAIPTNHAEADMDGTTYALHDYFHLLDLFSVSVPIRQYAAELYEIIFPIIESHGVAEQFDLYLDRLVELGEEYRLMKLVARFPMAMIEDLLRQHHPVISAIVHTLQNHSWSDPYTAQKSEATTQALSGLFESARTYGWDVFPTSQSIAAVLKENPPEAGTGPQKLWYDITDVATGAVRYPRLEALVAHLVAHLPSPQIIERGSGQYGHLAVSVARRYPITIIEKLKEVRPHLTGVPPEILAKILLVDARAASPTPAADLAIWLHPYPTLLKDDDDVLDPEFMGQDVKPGGYLVIQTEVQRYFIPQTPDWELVHEGVHAGSLAPSRFVKYTNTIIILRRTTAQLPRNWHDLADTNPNAFAVRAQHVVDATKAAMTERIARGQNSNEMITWYWQTILPEVTTIHAVLKGLLSHQPAIKLYELARELRPWATIIPAWLADGHLTELRNFLGVK